jgi:hypothetical protein
VNKLKFFALSFLIIFQFACTTYAPSNVMLGKNKAELIGLLGKPNRISKDGLLTRLDFQRGPAGMHTFFVYLDDSERIISWRQVLTEENFALIKVDMTKDKVIELIGQTDMIKQLARNRGYVWSYRFETVECKYFAIEFTSEDKVRSAGYIQRGGKYCRIIS